MIIFDVKSLKKIKWKNNGMYTVNKFFLLKCLYFGYKVSMDYFSFLFFTMNDNSGLFTYSDKAREK